MKNRIITFILVILMFLMQVPFSAFAEETTTGTLNPATLSNGKVGHSYSMTFGFESETYTSCDWSIDGSLPAGLELSSYTSTKNPKISGVPETAGSYTFKMQAKCDVSGETKVVFEKEYTWVIEPADPLRITGESKWYGYEVSSGSPYAFNHTCEINLKFDATWSMEAVDGATLPAGLTINSSTGEITWASPKVGKYQMKVTATCNGESASKILKLIVIPYAGCAHANLTKTVGKTATCKENGTPDYWYCDDCEGFYYDADCKIRASENVAESYTMGFHEDTNNDNKCDTCGKIMPIFKKVTTTDEITSYGMYLVVSQIGGRYYTLKTLEESYSDSIEAVQIIPNADGTFSYPRTETGVMILKTSAAAMCEDLDRGLLRYGFSTTVHGIPCALDGYDGSISMYRYEDASKYGFRIKLTESGNAEIADVYSEVWGSGESEKSEKGGGSGSGVLSAYEETADAVTKQYFSFATREDLTANSIALYRLAYVSETVSGQSYTLSDAPLSDSKVAVTNSLASMVDAANNEFSVVSGISDALKETTVEGFIADEELEETEFAVQAYAMINAISEQIAPTEEGATGTVATEITYEVKPYIAIKDAAGTTLAATEVPDTGLNGTRMTVTLCVGSMRPAQIIHYKSDGTQEYFYAKDSAEVQDGANSFTLIKDYENGNLVTFEIDSFSQIKILATAEPESTMIDVKGDCNGDGKVNLADALVAMRACLNQTSLPEADINGDGKLTLADVLAILRLCAG